MEFLSCNFCVCFCVFAFTAYIHVEVLVHAFLRTWIHTHLNMYTLQHDGNFELSIICQLWIGQYLLKDELVLN